MIGVMGVFISALFILARIFSQEKVNITESPLTMMPGIQNETTGLLMKNTKPCVNHCKGPTIEELIEHLFVKQAFFIVNEEEVDCMQYQLVMVFPIEGKKCKA